MGAFRPGFARRGAAYCRYPAARPFRRTGFSGQHRQATQLDALADYRRQRGSRASLARYSRRGLHGAASKQKCGWGAPISGQRRRVCPVHKLFCPSGIRRGFSPCCPHSLICWSGRLPATELVLQFCFCAFQPRTLRLGQGLAGAVDIEGEHRQRRAIGTGLAARTMFGGALERCRDFLGAGQLEHAAFQIERVAFPCHPLRPSLRRGFLRGCRAAGFSDCGLPWPCGLPSFGHVRLHFLFCRKRSPDRSVPRTHFAVEV